MARQKRHVKQVIAAYINESVSEKPPVRTDEQLKADYMRTFVKYALQGIAITHPEKVAIFEKKSRKPRIQKEFTI